MIGNKEYREARNIPLRPKQDEFYMAIASDRLAVNDIVILDCPENLRLHKEQAIVHKIEPWGAKVKCSAAASGEYRAAWDEMIPFQLMPKGISRVGSTPMIVNAEQVATAEVDTVIDVIKHGDLPPIKQHKWKDSGYSGDICQRCQGSRMRRNGTCLLCEDCGETSGCS